MLKSVRDIGRAYSGNDLNRLLNAFPSYVKVKDNPENIQVIRINVKMGAKMEFKDVDFAYLKNDPSPFLYKALSGNDKNLSSPTVVLNFYEYGKRNPDPLLIPLKKYSESIKKMDSQFLRDFAAFLDENADKISMEVSQKIQIFSNKSAVVTFAFDSDGNISYPSDLKDILDAFLKLNENEVFQTASCCVCGKHAPISKERLSDIEVFKFATVEKLGFLPNMNPKNVIKILPICEDCYRDMQFGSKVILKKLDFPFYLKDKVWVIPKSFNGNLEVLRKTIENVEKIGSANIDKTSLKRRSMFEERILNNAQNLSDLVTMDFIFYRAKNSQRQIILNIQDMPPTWIKEIAEAINHVDDLFKQMAGEWYNFSLRTIYDLTVEKSQNPSMKDFYLIIKNIFEKRKVVRSLIVSNALVRIRSSLYGSFENGNFSQYVYDAMAILELFEILNKQERSKKMVSTLSDEEAEMDKTVDEFFNNGFDTSEKKGLFYLGVLVGRLVACQQSKMGKSKAPFYSQLKGLRMKEEDFKGLYSKVLNKMIEYSSEKCYLDSKNVEMIKRLCAYYLNSTKKWDLNIDEANFVFASGMTLTFAEPFKIMKGENSDGKSEEI